jgi:cobalt-zinc-cadmium efflux system protein
MLQMKEHTHHHHTHENSSENITYAFFLNLGFTIIEIIGGFLTNSVAILSDAIHDFGDSISLGLAWYFEKVANKRSDKKFSYGYKRFSLLGAIINSVILTVGSVLILIETIPRIFHPAEPDAGGMFLLAILGIIVNGAAVFKLKKGKSINEKVVTLHLLEDVLGWAAILIGSALMYFFNWTIIDPLLSIGISIFILINVIKNIGISMRIILQGTPQQIDNQEISDAITAIDEIKSMHDLHIWSIDGNYHIATLHVVVSQNESLEKLAEIKTSIRKKLESLEIHHATIEFETVEENCLMENCSCN